MKTDLMFSSKSDKWNTPKKLYEALDGEFHFQLDPCPENPVEDGLSIPWDKTAYINPPYGRGIGKWVQKAYESSLEGHTMVMLLPARTDTTWWHDYVLKAHEIRLIKGRLYFNDQGGPAPFPSAIVIFRGDQRRLLPRFYSVNKEGKIING